jgi:hypothetical protein
METKGSNATKNQKLNMEDHSLPPPAPCGGLDSGLAILSSIIIPKSIHGVELIK